MGWLQDDFKHHEGFLIGHVNREGCPVGAGEYRELAAPLDSTTRRVDRVSAGCKCGWRSKRWAPIELAIWESFAVVADGDDSDRARKLWQRHLAIDVDGERLILQTLGAFLDLASGASNDQQQAFEATVAAAVAAASRSSK